MPVRQQMSHSQGFWQASQRAVAGARSSAAAGGSSSGISTGTSGGSSVATRRRVTRMMPIGVPRVPYRTPKEGSWQWVDIWNCLYRERIIFLSKPVDEELGNQVRAGVSGCERMPVCVCGQVHGCVPGVCFLTTQPPE